MAKATTTTTTREPPAKEDAAARLLKAGWSRLLPALRDPCNPGACWIPPWGSLADRTERRVIGRRLRADLGVEAAARNPQLGESIEQTFVTARFPPAFAYGTEQAYALLLRQEEEARR